MSDAMGEASSRNLTMWAVPLPPTSGQKPTQRLSPVTEIEAIAKSPFKKGYITCRDLFYVGEEPR
jgi:hypothetical protein